MTDALGVGAYRTMNDAGRLDSGPVAAFANQRLTRTRESLRESLEMLREAGPSAEAAFIDPLRQTLGAVARRLEEVVFDDIDCA